MIKDVGPKLRDREIQAYHRGYQEEMDGLPCNRQFYKNKTELRWYMQGHFDAQKVKAERQKNELVDY